MTAHQASAKHAVLPSTIDASVSSHACRCKVIEKQLGLSATAHGVNRRYMQRAPLVVPPRRFCSGLSLNCTVLHRCWRACGSGSLFSNELPRRPRVLREPVVGVFRADRRIPKLQRCDVNDISADEKIRVRLSIS
jgi:hypothetical protein